MGFLNHFWIQLVVSIPGPEAVSGAKRLKIYNGYIYIKQLKPPKPRPSPPPSTTALTAEKIGF
jgi:hypothetical protein